MEILLKRIARRPTYTIGRLYIDGEYFCDTVEDTDRDLNHNGRFDNGEVKVYAQTAIPNGRYRVTMAVQSPKFSQRREYDWWKPNGLCGMLPRLLDVPHFEGILIHAGSSARSSAGCIILAASCSDSPRASAQLTSRRLASTDSPKATLQSLSGILLRPAPLRAPPHPFFSFCSSIINL